MAYRSARNAIVETAWDEDVAAVHDRLAAIFPFPSPASPHVSPAWGDGCPELECLRGRLPTATLTAAERRAAEIGVGADRVLVAAGVITDEAYLTALAAWHGIRFDPLEPPAFQDCPVTGERLIEAAAAGLLPLRQNGELIWVIAPRGQTARRLCTLLAQYPHLAPRLGVTTTAHLNRFIARHAATALQRRATGMLRRRYPEFSAGPKRNVGRAPIVIGMAAALILPTGLMLYPAALLLAVNVVLATIFASWIGLRLFGCMVREPRMQPRCTNSDNKLPVYTVIAALYREASSIELLLSAIYTLDYPGIR